MSEAVNKLHETDFSERAKKILAQETLKGGSPSSTTSGGDRTGAAPNVASCKKLAEKMVAEMK